MNRIRCHLRGFFTAVLLSLFAAAAHADDPLVYSTIQPAQIYLGETAELRITNLGDGTNPIATPVVSGLKFEIVARTREIQIVNGTMLPSSSTVWRVTPEVAGIFTIPGATPKSQPLVLQVNAAPSGAYVPRGGPAAPVPPPIFSSGSLPKGVHLTEDGSAYVRLNVQKRDLYEGESVPVDIEVGVRSGFVLRMSQPTIDGDSFALNPLSSPEHVEKLINGEPFVVYSFHSIMTMLEPGNFSLTAGVPLTVKIRTQPRRESFLDDRFGDPFFQNLFGTTVPKDIRAVSPPLEIKVAELPLSGLPADFHGAIGTFHMVSDISPAKGDVGDPLTLRMRITGTGNFDRVDSPMLDHVDQWKTYPPKSSFNTSDPIGLSGVKTFEQPIIASKPGVQTLPALSFSYFDPNSRRYETLHAAPLDVTISPSLADSTLSASQVAAKTAATGASKPAVGLRADHADDDYTSRSLVPLYLQPKFLALPSLLALALTAAWLARGRRGEQSLPVKRAMEQMQAAARARNEGLFFETARGALQCALGVRWGLAPEAVTTAEVDARAGGDEDLRRLFALADESKYSGRTPNVTDFERWLSVARDRLTAGESA